jgi:hypothetical protein
MTTCTRCKKSFLGCTCPDREKKMEMAGISEEIVSVINEARKRIHNKPLDDWGVK